MELGQTDHLSTAVVRLEYCRSATQTVAHMKGRDDSPNSDRPVRRSTAVLGVD